MRSHLADRITLSSRANCHMVERVAADSRRRRSFLGQAGRRSRAWQQITQLRYSLRDAGLVWVSRLDIARRIGRAQSSGAHPKRRTNSWRSLSAQRRLHRRGCRRERTGSWMRVRWFARPRARRRRFQPSRAHRHRLPARRRARELAGPTKWHMPRQAHRGPVHLRHFPAQGHLPCDEWVGELPGHFRPLPAAAAGRATTWQLHRWQLRRARDQRRTGGLDRGPRPGVHADLAPAITFPVLGQD